MAGINTITSTHVNRLGHTIDEIRIRALDNIISKLEFGFGCDRSDVKKELILKLFDWFSFAVVPQPEKALNLLLFLVKESDKSYLNAFGKIQFQNKIDELRKKIEPAWQDILNQIEEVVLNPERFQTLETNKKCSLRYFQDHDKYKDHGRDNYNVTDDPSVLESTIPFDLTLPRGSTTTVSKTTEGGVKWLVMPWQPLVMSDKGVLAAVEEALSNMSDINLVLHTCQFITNVMLQDFPAEVFLQRPAIVQVLHSFLEGNENVAETDIRYAVFAILKTLHKLTRSLRFRIYYYCDPSVANKKQKLLARKLNNNAYPSSEARDSPDGDMLEANYQAYQSAGTSDSHSIDNIDDSVLQLQQILIPTYCTESLRRVISQLSIPVDPVFPLKNVKYVTDLVYELVQLLSISVVPNVWLCNDGVTLKIAEDLKNVLNLLGDVIEYFRHFCSVEHFRIMYLHSICITMKLLSNLVPLEVADVILPKSVKMAICSAVMDAPIYLMYPSLHLVLQEYARRFRGADEITCVKLFDETRVITKSMSAAILLTKQTPEQTPSEILNTIYVAKLSLSYHKNMSIIRKTINFLQNINRYSLSKENSAMANKLILSLLANGDVDVQYSTYRECHKLVKNILGIQYTKEKFPWDNLTFLLESNVLTEIICHGTTHENDKIKELSEEILVYLLKGRIHMGEGGWLKVLEAITPVLPLLQCHAHSSTPLGQCITKMLDPDISSSIQLPYIEVLKGNIRLLYSSECDIREEALCRLIYLLGKEKNSTQKLPRLSSLHGLPLSSLCVFERQTCFRRPEGNYQKNNLLSVLEMLNEPNVDPKMRKSALVQTSVMLTDISLHQHFITENGLSLILKIFSSALIEKDYDNYPDSVIPILTILKLLVLTESTIRHDLSNEHEVYLNIIRSLFLFPNNECVKIDGSQLLFLLLYNEYILRSNDKNAESCSQLNISLPYIIVSNMRLPFICKFHWKTSIHRRSDISVLHSNQSTGLIFIRQYWSWEWNGGLNMLWKQYSDLNDSDIPHKLMIQETEFHTLQFSHPRFCCQQQLFAIQNSTTHNGVSCALDFLSMYLKLCKLLDCEEIESISALPWEETFERFLISHPASKEDCDLFVDVSNFLELYINIMKNGKITWVNKRIKNVTKSLAELFHSLDVDNQDVHRSILKLARTCCAIEKNENSNETAKNTWISFIELVVSTLCFGDQQHFYNLAYLDWLLTCLTYLIGQCQWGNHQNLLVSLGNTLIELIVSFHGAGTVSFMGLSITRNSIICLNHLLHHMQINLNKNAWISFWYEEGRSLNWLPMLWQNRDPLVRASALQLLAGLITAHSPSQLLNAVAQPPSELCYILIQCVNNRDECCIVREQACIAFNNLVKSCSSVTFQHISSLQPRIILTYIEQNNVYYEISVLCSSIYMLTTLDSDELSNRHLETGETSTRSAVSSLSLVPRTISYLYNCQDELQPFSARESEMTNVDVHVQLIATPSLITVICTLLNNLIFIGQQEVVRLIYEHSIEKYLFGCLNKLPGKVENRKEFHCSYDILEMYINICTVLTNCIVYTADFTTINNFSSDQLYTMFSFLNVELYQSSPPRMMQLRNRLWTEIYNFISVLSLTEGQHFEVIQTALDLIGSEMVLISISIAMKNNSSELRMSGIACLTFLLSQEIQRQTSGKDYRISLKKTIDTCLLSTAEHTHNNDLQNIISNVNKFTLKESSALKGFDGSVENEDDGRTRKNTINRSITIGAELCEILLHLFIAHNYTRSKKNSKQMEDKEIIISALTNLLCVSREAKRVALEQNLPETTLMVLKELYVKLNLQPFERYKNQSDHDKKIHPLLQDVNGIFILLMNFSHGTVVVKERLTKEGLADILHKLWPWISSNKIVSTSTLKLIATFTTKCPKAAQSLTLTTILPGTGPRKTPNTISLIHVIIQLISKEIDKVGQAFDNHKLHYAFHILRNAVHVHECRVSISKSNLLQFFTRIHPISTKRVKPWPLIEVYCLEFLIDFTYYEEGQLCVPKATDGLDVLIQLAKCSTLSTRILAISILRNLAFNASNRSRLLRSVDFINLLHDVFKNGSLGEIKIASSMFWSLVCNNQKGKLIARSAGFSNSIREALGRFTLVNIGNNHNEQDLVKLLQYVLHILNPTEYKEEGDV